MEPFFTNFRKVWFVAFDQNEHDHFHLYSNIVFIIFKYLKQVWYCLNLRHMKWIEFMYYHKAVREEKE